FPARLLRLLARGKGQQQREQGGVSEIGFHGVGSGRLPEDQSLVWILDSASARIAITSSEVPADFRASSVFPLRTRARRARPWRWERSSGVTKRKNSVVPSPSSAPKSTGLSVRRNVRN